MISAFVTTCYIGLNKTKQNKIKNKEKKEKKTINKTKIKQKNKVDTTQLIFLE